MALYITSTMYRVHQNDACLFCASIRRDLNSLKYHLKLNLDKMSMILMLQLTLRITSMKKRNKMNTSGSGMQC